MHGICLLNPFCGTHVWLLTALQPASMRRSGYGYGKLVPLIESSWHQAIDGCRGLARLYLMRTLRVLRCRGTEHVRPQLFAAHPYLQVFDCEHDRWRQPPLLGDDSDEG